MNSRQLREWIDNPTLLNDETLLQLEFLVRRFPLFQVLHYLYLKNLKSVGDPQYESQLRSSVLYVTDREALYHYLESPVVAPVSEALSVQRPNLLQSIDSFLESVEQRQESRPASDLAKKALATQDYASYFLADLPDKPEVQEEPRLRHQDLVDRYIHQTQKERTFKPVSDLYPAKESPPPADLSLRNEGKSNSFFTESLAKIYIQQKKYDKALHIIKGLSLKYPEKSVYFADQIRFLELLVNNIKQ